MRKNLIAALFCFASCWLALPADACFWDHDTLKMERQRFPDTLELITGKFLRHSEAFYQWRVDDRTRQLATTISPNLYDDLAVALDKLGEHDRAIQLMHEKEEHFPGLYETYANLGTLYVHAGQLKRGHQWIERAIEINPDAHFGREIYQKLLVEYVLSKQVDGVTPLPLDPSLRPELGHAGFATFVLQVQDIDDTPEARVQELILAVKGVLGMMRFGNHGSPVLLEALGDLLSASDDTNEDARQMAARAYLKASYALVDARQRSAYRDLAESSLTIQTGYSTGDRADLDKLEAELQDELDEAHRWFQGVVASERNWILEETDVDAAFAETYYQAPQISSPKDIPVWVWGLGGCALAALGLRRRHRRRLAKAQAHELEFDNY